MHTPHNSRNPSIHSVPDTAYHGVRSEGPQFAPDALLQSSTPEVGVVGRPPGVEAPELALPQLLDHLALHQALVSGAQDLHAARPGPGGLAGAGVTGAGVTGVTWQVQVLQLSAMVSLSENLLPW